VTNSPPPPSDPYGQPTPSPGAAPSAKGFFGALFDFSFEHYVTPMIVKVVYILAIIVLGLTWLVFLATSFAQSSGYGLVVLILGPVGILLSLCLIRMTLEFYIAITRMSQDSHQRLC
jgi:apolipoprotein N-acyltransferase